MNVVIATGLGWRGSRPLTNEERLGIWAAKFYAAGHHHTRPRTNFIARNPQGDGTAVKRQDGTSANTTNPTARAARIADGATIFDQNDFFVPDQEDLFHPDGRPLTYDELAHGF